MPRTDQDLTPVEKRAIATLKKLAKAWPKTLVLFSLSGTLVVMDYDDFQQRSSSAEWLASIQGIVNDGGDT